MERPAAGAVPVLLICLAAAGCGGSDAPPAAAQTRTTPSVSVAPVQGRDEPVTIEATGSFEALEASDVAPESSGRVVATPVDVMCQAIDRAFARFVARRASDHAQQALLHDTALLLSSERAQGHSCIDLRAWATTTGQSRRQ